MASRERPFNILLIGDSRSGKTALAIRYHNNAFVDEYEETVDDVYESSEQAHTSLRIIDSSGKSQSSGAILRNLLCDTDALVLTYDMTSTESWNKLNDVVSQICMHKPYNAMPKVLVATKLDKETEREVSTIQGIELSKRLACPFFETSAYTSINVDLVFSSLVRQLKKHEADIKEQSQRNRSKHLSRLVCNKLNYVVYKCKLSSILY